MHLSAATVVDDKFLLPLGKVQNSYHGNDCFAASVSPLVFTHQKTYEAVVMALYGDATKTIVFNILTLIQIEMGGKSKTP